MYRLSKYILLFLALALILSGCRSSWSQPVPDTELMYYSYTFIETGIIPHGEDELHFVNSDGTNHQMMKTDVVFYNQVWSADGELLYGLSGIRQDLAYPAYWDIKKGKYKVCGNQMPSFFQIEGAGNPQNPYEVIIQNVTEIALYNLSSCQRVVSYIDNNDRNGNWEVSGFSYFSASRQLLYGKITNLYDPTRAYHIIKLDLNTGTEVSLAEGIHPSWSPDGTQIAFLWSDGLYIMRSDGSNPRRLVLKKVFNSFVAGGPLDDYISSPRWSPDGKWLLYHQCGDKICSYDKSQIIKLRVSDSQEELVITGGKYPSWRP